MRKGAVGLEFLECGDWVRVGEEPAVVVVGGAAGRVEDPPRYFERDQVGVGEVDGADAAVIDDVDDFAVSGLEAPTEVVECVVRWRCTRKRLKNGLALRGSSQQHPRSGSI